MNGKKQQEQKELQRKLNNYSKGVLKALEQTDEINKYIFGDYFIPGTFDRFGYQNSLKAAEIADDYQSCTIDSRIQDYRKAKEEFHDIDCNLSTSDYLKKH